MYLGRVLGGLFGVRMVKRGGREGWARVLESPGTSGESINEKRKGSGKREKREIEREEKREKRHPFSPGTEKVVPDSRTIRIVIRIFNVGEPLFVFACVCLAVCFYLNSSRSV